MLNVTLTAKARVASTKARHALMATKPYFDRAMDALLTGATEEERKDRERFLTGLHEVNDAELKEALACTANYDPVLFKKWLGKLSWLVAE